MVPSKVLLIIFAVCTAAALVWAARVAFPQKDRKKPEFSKLLVGWLIANGTVWTYLSYWLAYLGREEIAETLSAAVVTEILGVMAVYAGKALLENLSKNNTWPDKPDKPEKPGGEE